MYQQGQQSLEEAQILKDTAETQLASIQSQQTALQKQEKRLTQVRKLTIEQAVQPNVTNLSCFEGEAKLCKGEEGENSGDV